VAIIQLVPARWLSDHRSLDPLIAVIVLVVISWIVGAAAASAADRKKKAEQNDKALNLCGCRCTVACVPRQRGRILE
jgi:hypothetical protein